jgi:hypothetical protein
MNWSPPPSRRTKNQTATMAMSATPAKTRTSFMACESPAGLAGAACGVGVPYAVMSWGAAPYCPPPYCAPGGSTPP